MAKKHKNLENILIQWDGDLSKPSDGSAQSSPDSVDIVVGLTNKDISITKYKDAARTKIKDPTWQYRDFGIYGLGRIGGSSCVVSSNRLRKNGTEKC